jgi:predicted GNAT family acetyltransferase
MRFLEFAPTADPRDDFDGDAVPPHLHRLANLWWNGGDKQAEYARELAALGWTIQQVDYDYVQLKNRAGQEYVISDDEFDGDLYDDIYETIQSVRAHRGGLDLEARSDDKGISIYAYDRGGKEIAAAHFDRTGQNIESFDTSVKPDVRGQGIAAVMYDWAKELGYQIRRSSEQTPAGQYFWQKNRGQKQVWEDRVDEISDELRRNYLHRADQHVSRRMDRMARVRDRLNKSYEIYHADRPAGSAQIVDRFEADTPEQARRYYEQYIQNYESDRDFDLRLRRATGIMEDAKQQFLWHGSRNEIPVLTPQQAEDTGGNPKSNKKAIYATADKNFAIAMGLTERGSDTAGFPNDPQLVLFSGKIRHGQMVYLHKLPMYDANGRPLFEPGGNDREFTSVPSVTKLKPIEVEEVPVDQHLNLIRRPTPKDLELKKYYLQRAKQRVNEITKVPTIVKRKREHLDVMPNEGRPIPWGEESDYLGDLVEKMGDGFQLWSWTSHGTVTYYVFDTETRRCQLGTTGRPYESNPDSFIVHGVYSGPQNRYRAADLYAFLVLNRGLTLVSDYKQSEGGYRVWQELQRRYGKRINIHGFDTRTDEPVNVSADPEDEPDTHVDRATIKKAGPQMKKELATISRDLRFVASAR